MAHEEVNKGIDPGRIVTGGSSTGCAVALVWGHVTESEKEKKNAGVAGSLPMTEQLQEMRNGTIIAERKVTDKKKRWFVVHGTKDLLVPASLLGTTKKILNNLVDSDCVETRVYENMRNTTCSSALQDLLLSHRQPP